MEEQMEMVIPLLKEEYWYGGYVYGAEKMPVAPDQEQVFDFYRNETPNQGAPLLVSSRGRYLWGDNGFRAEIKSGKMRINGNVELHEGFQNLRGAYLDAMTHHFPFRKISLNKSFFETPVYNTWIELTFNQNEKDILNYAGDILKNGLPPGILMIDDGWSDYYGKWIFNKERFPHAEEMIHKLHQMGFMVMLWMCPYVTPDTVCYREACEKGYLIRREDGDPLIIKWWNGYSAALDLTNPSAVKWLEDQLGELCTIGIDGFKFDGGDSSYYGVDQRSMENAGPDEMSRRWCLLGEKYALNEFRAGWKAGGMSLIQRLCDKPHSWGADGIQALIPDILAQGIMGMPFGSPDMIGGGEYLNFRENSCNLDEELFVRHSEIACLMPVMQFSAAPWRVLDRESFEKVKNSIRVRKETLSYLMTCIGETEKTGEPVIRYMEYEFPHEGMSQITDQFMLGEKLLVAPVCEKGKNGRHVVIPKGLWERNGEIISGCGKEQFIRTEKGIPVMLWKKDGE